MGYSFSRRSRLTDAIDVVLCSPLCYNTDANKRLTSPSFSIVLQGAYLCPLLESKRQPTDMCADGWCGTTRIDGRAKREAMIAQWYPLPRCPPFHRDMLFLIALHAGGGVWFVLWWLGLAQPMTTDEILSFQFLWLAVGQPLVEELLFRGFLQGQLIQYAWGRQSWGGVTMANGLTSLLFMLGHWWFHPPFWAMAVLVPALVFGYFRDRYACVYPAIVLHMIYNAGYFLLMGLP